MAIGLEVSGYMKLKPDIRKLVDFWCKNISPLPGDPVVLVWRIELLSEDGRDVRICGEITGTPACALGFPGGMIEIINAPLTTKYAFPIEALMEIPDGASPRCRPEEGIPVLNVIPEELLVPRPQ